MNRRTDAARIEITSNDSDIVESRLARAISLLPFAVLFIGTLLWANAPVTTSKDWPLGLPTPFAKPVQSFNDMRHGSVGSTGAPSKTRGMGGQPLV